MFDRGREHHQKLYTCRPNYYNIIAVCISVYNNMAMELNVILCIAVCKMNPAKQICDPPRENQAYCAGV